LVDEVVACPNCSHINPADQRFCSNCGKPLTVTCPNCGTANARLAKFCGNCGTALSTEQPSPQRGFTEERRWATVLFADLSGFTNLSEKMDPEDIRTMIDRSMIGLGEIAISFGGLVEKIVGDQIMVVFGAPITHEDDAERAVRAALEMQQYSTDYTDELGGLPLRIGINTGEVMFAPVGPDSARRFTVLGDAVNVASRLQSSAPKGGILVGDETQSAARRTISFQPVDPLTVKGKEHPVRAWLAGEPLGGPAERTISVVPLIGRDKELALLSSLWRRVVDESKPQLVTVIGPPGIGKSRLTVEFARSAAGGRVLQGRSFPYGETTGYGALGEQIRQFAEIFKNDSLDQARRKLQALVAGVVTDDIEQITAHLLIMLGYEASTSGDKGALFFSVRRFFESLAKQSPLILVFEDIHWADASLLELIEALASRTRDAPLMLLCLARADLYDVRPNWGGGIPAFTSIQLEPLSRDDSKFLTQHLLEGSAGIGEMFDNLIETAEGNPLFLEELASSVAEKATRVAGVLPTTVRGIIAARLDALPPGSRRVMVDAAIVGKSFWPGALGMLRKNGSMRADLEFLEERDFVRRAGMSSIEGEAEYTFRHILTREVAYAMVPKAQRREKHALVADFLEGVSTVPSAESDSLLAYHYREAGNNDAAIDHLVRAAEAVSRAWAKGQAISLYEQAIALLPPDAEEQRLLLRLRLASALQEAGDLVKASQAYDELIPQLEGSRKLEALTGRARAAFWLADADGMRAFTKEAMALSEMVQDEELKAAAVTLSVMSMSMDGKVKESTEAGEEALRNWPPAWNPRELGNLKTQHGLYMAWVGHYDSASKYLQEAYEWANDSHIIDIALNAGAAQGLALTGAGRHEEAFEVFAEVVTRGMELEITPRLTSRAVSMWAGALREIYRLDESAEKNRQAIELAKRSGFPNSALQSETDLLFLSLERHDVGAAQRELPRVLNAAETLKGWHQWLVLGRLADVSARVKLESGELEATIDAAHTSIDAARSKGRAKYECLGLITLGQALYQLKRPIEAADSLRAALSVADLTRTPGLIWESAHHLSQALAASGDDDSAEEASGKASTTLKLFLDSLSEESRLILLETPQVNEILKV
jgi:class 3 adenylate cyclase/tetratricopeptide (TPR) repeat protein